RGKVSGLPQARSGQRRDGPVAGRSGLVSIAVPSAQTPALALPDDAGFVGVVLAQQLDFLHGRRQRIAARLPRERQALGLVLVASQHSPENAVSIPFSLPRKAARRLRPTCVERLAHDAAVEVHAFANFPALALLLEQFVGSQPR